MTNISLNNLRMTLLDIDPMLAGTEETEVYRTALTLLAAWICGSDTAELARFTDLPREFVAQIRERMIAAELWTETGVCCDHWWISAEVFSSSAFWTDVLVGEGQVVRRWVEAERSYRYCHKDYAPLETASQSFN